MKMFSECSGECCVCSNGGFCLAGHGDDDFSLASKEKIIENLDEGKYPNYIEYMIKCLANEYGYIYNPINVGRKKKEKQLTNEQPVEESFGGFTFKVVVAGNCVSCGKRIDDDNIYLCKDCRSKQEAIANLEMIRVAFVEPITEGQAKLIDDTFDMAIKALGQQPCEDCISRQAVLALAKEECDTAIIPYRKFVKDVNALPPVTPQLKMGRWIDEGFYAEGHSEHAYRCSECDEHYIGYVGEFKHCPNCGARMENEE